MTDDSYLFDKKKKSWVSRVLEIIFVLTAFCLVLMTVLFNAGGASDFLKGVVEKFAGDSFGGYPATVTRLVDMRFFPQVGVDVDGVQIMSKPEGGYPLAEFGKVQAYMSFWDVATSTQRFSKLYVENFLSVKGFLGPEEYYIEKIYIDHDIEEKAAVLKGNGKVGIHPWAFSLALDVFGSQGSYRYTPSQNAVFSIDLSDIHFDGTLINHEDGYFKIEGFTLTQGVQKTQGDLFVSVLGERLLKVKADVSIADGRSLMASDLVIDLAQKPIKISGTVSSEKFVFGDLGDDKAFLSIFTHLREILGFAQPDNQFLFGAYDLDLVVDFQDLVLNERHPDEAITLKFPLVQSGHNLKIGAIKNGDSTVMPMVFAVQQGKADGLTWIMQNGFWDKSLFSSTMTAVADVMHEYDGFNVECGIVDVMPEGNGNRIHQFMIKTDHGVMGTRAQMIKKGESARDVPLVLLSGEQAFKPVSLSSESYDFVAAGLQGGGSASPCAPYILKSPETVTTTVPEQSEN